MAFAIYYNDEDASTISGSLNRSDLTQAEAQMARKIWNGGLKNWSTAPFSLCTCDDPNTYPVTSRRIVIDAQGVVKQDLVNLLNSIGNRLGPGIGGYLTTLALDVQRCADEPV